MKKIAAVLVAISVLLSAAYAISFNRIVYPIKTKDATDHELRQDRAPTRIVSASPAITEILFELNLQDRLVGITEKCDYPEDAKKIEKVGGDKLDASKVLKVKPDLVLVRLDENNADIESLRKIKFTETVSDETVERTLEVFAVDPKSLQDIFTAINTIGTVTNREHSAYSLLQRMKRRIGWTEARARNGKDYMKQKALLIVSKNPVIAAGEGTYLGDLLKYAGLINAAPEGKTGYIKMSRKEVEKVNPDIIITSKDVAGRPKDVWGNRNFRKTSAGRDKRSLCVETDILMRPGPRITLALEEIAKFAYGWSDDNEQTSE